MNLVLNRFLLATVTRSEEVINDAVLVFATVVMLISAVLGLAALVLSLIPRSIGLQSVRCGVLAMLLSLFPIVLAWAMYRIDYVPIDTDGTNASGPLWEAIGLPCIPMFLGMIAIASRYGFRLPER